MSYEPVVGLNTDFVLCYWLAVCYCEGDTGFLTAVWGKWLVVLGFGLSGEVMGVFGLWEGGDTLLGKK